MAISPMLKSEYLFSVLAREEPKVSILNAKGCCAFRLAHEITLKEKMKKVFLGRGLVYPSGCEGWTWYDHIDRKEWVATTT